MPTCDLHKTVSILVKRGDYCHSLIRFVPLELIILYLAIVFISRSALYVTMHCLAIHVVYYVYRESHRAFRIDFVVFCDNPEVHHILIWWILDSGDDLPLRFAIIENPCGCYDFGILWVFWITYALVVCYGNFRNKRPRVQDTEIVKHGNAYT